MEIYDIDEVRLYTEDPDRQECPECESEKTYLNTTFGFYKCERCSLIWGFDKDDPDYEDAEPWDYTNPY